MIKTTYIELEYYEVEAMVKQHYGFGRNTKPEYSFPLAQECSNDTSHTFTVNADDFDEEEWKYCLENGFDYSNNIILSKLCKDGHIEAGKYLVNVCW